MPHIKLQHVVSVSSEDKNHPAENLLRTDTYKKWKSASVGEKQVSVVLQFEKASEVHSIDIGNEGSAFVEVLVGKQTDPDHSYQVLLVASSFMSPMESHNGTNVNRVRMFDKEKLSKATVDLKWDRVKIVCTQPFNKTCQYGLSFIKLHSSQSTSDDISDAGAAGDTNVQNTRIGSFILKSEDDKSSSLVPGSLFAKRKETSPPLKGAAEIRAASVKAEAKLMLASAKASSSPSQMSVKRKTDGESDMSNAKKQQSVKTATPLNQLSSHTAEVKPTTSSQKKNVKESTSLADLPFNKIMSGVVLSLSGFQNPLRGEIRDKAIQMGAKYCPDWDSSCTHLICAFPNTPKFNEAKKSGGVIVSKDWILSCHRKKSALSMDKFILKGDGDSDDEATQSLKTTTKMKVSAQKNTQKSKVETKTETRASSSAVVAADDDDDYGASTDVDSPVSASGCNKDDDASSTDVISSGDTDDEINRAVQGGVDTSKLPMPTLPDFFGGTHFLLFGEFDDKERRTLVRYITAFNGCLDEYMNDLVKYVITKSDWDDEFDEALATNDNLIFAKPRWLFSCASKHRLVPYQPFLVVPQDK